MFIPGKDAQKLETMAMLFLGIGVGMSCSGSPHLRSVCGGVFMLVGVSLGVATIIAQIRLKKENKQTDLK